MDDNEIDTVGVTMLRVFHHKKVLLLYRDYNAYFIVETVIVDELNHVRGVVLDMVEIPLLEVANNIIENGVVVVGFLNHSTLDTD